MAASFRKLLLPQLSKISTLNVRVVEARLPCIYHTALKTTSTNDKAQKRFKSGSKMVAEDQILPPIKFKRMFYDRLVNFIDTSVGLLGERMPRTYEAYQTFRTGISMFTADTKLYYSIATRLWAGERLSVFTRRELELYRRFSSDLPVVGLVIIIAFAPGGVFAFPLAYMFPRFLLSPHFWTDKQKAEFREKEMVSRLKHYPKILDLMYQRAEGNPKGIHIKKAVNMLESTVLLSQRDFNSLQPLFDTGPLRLDALGLRHRWHLSKAFKLPFRRKKLMKEAIFLRYIDVALRREGINNLTEEDLDQACTWRGLNPAGVDRTTKLSFLKEWTAITENVHEKNVSLLLHLPVLLGYTKPSNRKLMSFKFKQFIRGP